jgi:hypothetical protein
MEIRDELAGSTRHCPKCKTEFQVPLAGESDGDETSAEGVEAPAAVEAVETAEVKAAVPEDIAVQAAAEIRQAAAQPKSRPGKQDAGEEDDENEDYLPAFVTKSSDKKAKPAASSARKDDDGPTLSIPKTAAKRPKSSTFDPDAFLNDQPQPAKKPKPFEDDSDSLAEATPAPPTRRKEREPKLPTPGSAPLSDTDVPATGGTRDRAQAARELRQALKDSAMRPAAEPAKAREGIMSDLALTLSEVGSKGFAIFFGILAFAILLYFLSYHFMVGGPTLPPLGYVTGNVTLDGTPAVGVAVHFQPMKAQEENDDKKASVEDPRTSTGVTDAKGNYKMMYEERIAGVAIGKCRVWVSLPPPQVANEYSQMAMNVTEVKSGSQKYDIQLTSQQPKK